MTLFDGKWDFIKGLSLDPNGNSFKIIESIHIFVWTIYFSVIDSAVKSISKTLIQYLILENGKLLDFFFHTFGNCDFLCVIYN